MYSVYYFYYSIKKLIIIKGVLEKIIEKIGDEKFVEKVITILAEQEELEKIAADLDQQELEDVVSKIEKLDDPEEIKEMVMQFDDEHNAEREQKLRIDLLNELKKNGVFKKFGKIKGYQEMWQHLVNKDWGFHYRFES